jgi:choline dehydrogenase-like flavoprotein
MIDDLRRLEDGAELRCDLCLIGAGAAGIAIAREFLGTDADVLLLESGGLRRSADTESLNEGESSGLDPASLLVGRGRLLGGATNLWGGQCLAPEPIAFEPRPWVPYSGWPLRRRDLEPFYRRAEALFRIEGEAYDERVWDAFGVPRPAISPNHLVHRFTVWCPHPHLGRLYRRALAESRNVRVLLHATATEIVTTPDGDGFDRLRVATPEGASATVRARACVLCGGAIENARLLLASRGGRPDGVGNRHDVVGRYFQDHPNSHSATITGGDVGRLQDLYGFLYRGRVRYLPRLVLSADAQRGEQVACCAAVPVFDFGDESGIEAARRVYRALRDRRRPEGLMRELVRMGKDAPRLASVVRRRVVRGRAARLPPARVTLTTHVEQVPNPESRVTLSTRYDHLGVPLPKVDWRLSDLDRRTAEVMVGRVSEGFARLGLGEVRPEPWLSEDRWIDHARDSFHPMGTTRLGTDPRASVVDPYCEVHGVAGLFVAGSSVFPTAGSANPTLTIAALAIRLGDHLKTVLGRRSLVEARGSSRSPPPGRS